MFGFKEKIYETVAPQRVAFLGLGRMGYPMAAHLARAGHHVNVYNRNGARSYEWQAELLLRNTLQSKIKVCDSIHEAVKACDIVFCCLCDDESVRSVLYGVDGAIAAMSRGTILVDHTTTSASLAKEVHAIAAKNSVAFIDAPVSGGQGGAVSGTLTVMCGGGREIFERVRPIFSAYAQSVALIGDVGSGQLAKMVNQICIAGVIQGLSEALAFGVKSGLDMEAVLSVISKGAAQSWQMDNRGKSMLAGKFDFGFAVDLMRKDLGIVLDAAKLNHAALPCTALIDQFYGDVQTMGGGQLDTSSLIMRLMSVS